jgi:hypothetical protein
VAIALCGFCLLTALFSRFSPDQDVHLQKNVAVAGALLTLLGPGVWSLGRSARSPLTKTG